ncbi:hypothetical protein QBC38DRAFT_363619 [Podospora fimiseda]|uniref:Ankyrin repeat protein n=1 Tax=Podospora fimiseda TaxID=252190 RepID=A0AAN7BQR8_9PEZI|nr:hypothetical protein QBC38DRAFT_363619 [Podospora fimiseda]
MDAQNAVEPASTKPAAASPKRPGSDADQQQKSSAPAVTKLSSIAKPDLPPRDSNNRSSASGSGSASQSQQSPDDDAAAADGNSDAETIVLPGKDGNHSPSKVRKIIKHEEKSDGEDTIQPPPIPSLLGRKHSNMKQDRQDRDGNDRGGDKGDRPDRGERGDRGERHEKGDREKSNVAARRNNGPGEGGGSSVSSLAAKKKKQQHLEGKSAASASASKTKDGSSGLSSAPTSPPQRRRRASNAQQSKSDSEAAPVDSPKTSVKDKDRPLKAVDKGDKTTDKSVPHKRKAPRQDSDDEGDNRKVRRQRTSGSGLDASRKQQQPQATSAAAKPHHEAHSSNRTRSASPLPSSRPHRRSTSTQLPGHHSLNGLSQKKKRVPAPLQSTDYHSDESSASGSPYPRSSKLRSLTTPATAESTISPAKMAPHKKHLDAHGQTFLARACAKGEYEVAKTRLQERPEDINVADYAGNTPLQIAALNGYDDIVKLLVDAGCNLDCVNNDKDTPLLDAVENGHLEVVNILLDAGVNPRKANAYGQEPIMRVNDDLDNADEIRQALQNAKKKMGERRRTSEEHQPEHNDAASSHGPESPRRSPGASGNLHGGGGRRAGTVRATKTSNHLLYMPMDDKTLRAAAARGDEETVTRILQVRETFDDPESMVAAARGGHEMVMQLLLALGRANPDPQPIATPDGIHSEYSTPMLAAIGQENIKVIRLLLDQTDFDPTRRFKGETYYEIARRRRGPNWMDEEHMLKDAYDEYKKSHKDITKNRSPNRREQDKEVRKSRVEPKEPKDDTARSHKRKASSPAREPKKSATSKVVLSPKEKRRANSFTTHHDDQTSPKRGPGRPKKDDRGTIPLIAISDREASPAPKPTAKPKRTESEVAAASSEGETVKPRRKLISARELKDKREKQQRRLSLTSNASSILKEPSSPRDEIEKPDKTQKTEKYHDRTKAIKRDESRDRLSVAGDSTGKRHRASATPPTGPVEKEGGENPIKRRRIEGEARERRLKPSQSDDRHLKAPAPREGGSSANSGSRLSSKNRDDDERKPVPKARKSELQSEKARQDSASVAIKSEDQDIEMPDADPPISEATESRFSQQKKKEEQQEKKRQAEAEAAAREAKKKEDEKRRKDEEEKERVKAEEAKKKAEAEARRRAEEEQRRKEEEEEKKRKEEEERKREEQRKQKELEERRRLEEERKRQEEEERRLREEAERKQREEAERLHREQLEREAEEARRKEEERKELIAREEARRRAVREAEARRIREQEERLRLAKLPPLLQWLETAVHPKLPEVAENFSTMQGVRYDCIQPGVNGTPEGREQWLLNTQVALLLGEKDLELSRYTGWARVRATLTAKEAIWRLEADRYALTTSNLYELGKTINGYYPDNEPETMSYPVRERLRANAWEKFSAMDMFFVKASEFLYIASTTHHLSTVKLTMAYLELPEPGASLTSWLYQPKWKSDPLQAQTVGGFAPGNKYFLRGQLVSEDKPSLRQASTSPFPRHRFVRHGFVAVSQDDAAAYGALRCKEDDGDDSMMVDRDLPLLPNGVHSSPVSTSSSHLTGTTGAVNGLRSPALVTAAPVSRATATTNGVLNQPLSPTSESGAPQARPLVNGIHPVANAGAH